MKKKSILITIAILIITMTSIAQTSGTFTDLRDGITYKTVKIGTQTWMAENLAYKTSSGCWANNDSVSNVISYGYLYNWETAKNVCPIGWHLPTDAEWKTLEMALGMSQVDADKTGWRGTNEGGKLKETDTTHWGKPNLGATNNKGFTALPGGLRYEDGTFFDVGSYGDWWSSTVYSIGNA